MFLFFYCEQVSIAGQPGGVEAARVKIRVSWNSATFVLKEHSAQTLGLCRLVSLYFWPLWCRPGFLGVRVWVQYWPIFTRGTKNQSVILCFCQMYCSFSVCPHDPGDPVELVSRRCVLCISTPPLICVEEGETDQLSGCGITLQSSITLNFDVWNRRARRCSASLTEEVGSAALFSVLTGIIRAAEKQGCCSVLGQCRD